MRSGFLSLIIFSFLHNAYSFSFAEHFTVCHKNDPQLDLCLVQAIEKGFKVLGSTGLPDIQVPSIDPLKASKLTIGAGNKAVNLEQKYSDVRAVGFSTLKVEKAHFDIDKKVLSFTINHPVLKQYAKYDINGKILVLPVYGKGDSTITLNNVVIDHKIYLEEENKNNEKFFKITKYVAKINVNGGHIDFKNLFNGNKLLSDNIHQVTNDNWDLVFEDIKEGLATSYSNVFKSVAKALFDKIPIDVLLPN